MRGTPTAEVEFHVFSSARPTSGHRSFFCGLFRKILSYLNKEALCAGINVIEDIENNKSLKEAVKSRLAKSQGNLKRKAKAKISSLMRGAGYKIFAKSTALQFPSGDQDRRTAHRKRRRKMPMVKRKSSRSTIEKKSKKEEKENSYCRKKDEKNYPLRNIESRNATFQESDIFS